MCDGKIIFSACDGISCGRVALDRANINVGKYYASEIEKDSIKIAQKNYPDTIQVGDVTKVDFNDYEKINLFLAGTPCQSLSSSGLRLGFDGKSGLFYDVVTLFRQMNPEYFLFENVVPHKKGWQDAISKELGAEPIFINSRLVSAQERKRLYWTNIPVVGLPEDKNISFSDISEDGWAAAAMRGRRISPDKQSRSDYDKSIPIVQQIECRDDNKTNCLTTVSKDNVAVSVKGKRMPAKECNYRYLTPNEYEALQTLPKNFTEGVSASSRRKMIGNGWTVDVIAWILSFLPEEYKK